MIQIVGPRLSQWDTGRYLSVTGSTATHAHMANKGDSYAPIIDIVNGEAKIPNYLLQTGKELCVYLVLDGITQERNSFFVQKRERPENYVYEDDRRNYIYELIENAENAVNRANEAASNAEAAKDDLKKYVDDTLDSLSAVLYTQQDLTAEQKANARQNIGVVSTLIVTVEKNNTASHSAAQVYAHVQKGGNVVLDYNGLHVALSAAGDGSAYFAYTDDEHITTVYELWGNEIVEIEGGSGSGGGSNVLTVFATGQDTASHNAGSVHGHLEKGGYVLFTYGEYIYTCAASNPAESTFIASMEGNEDLRIIKLYDDGSFEMFIATYGSSIEIDNTLSVKGKAADAKAVGDAIGDISAVLAELHAYAEALKGGGAV